jgi:trigger factor
MSNETATVTQSDSITAPDAVTTKLPQKVEIKDAGPCKKHVKVTVEREAIDTRFNEKYSEIVLSKDHYVDGFRPGKAPRKIIEQRYKKQVASEVKTEVLMASLEQLADEQTISPLAPPDLNPHTIVIPESGPFVYEFDIEVRPEFDVPSYKGLKLKKPVHKFTDADVKKETARVLEPYGQLTPKEGAEAVVALNDIVTADLVIQKDGKDLNTVKESRVKVENRLALADGVAEDFGKKLVGAKPGDTRTVDIRLSDEIANLSLRGTTVQAAFKILDVKMVKLPELDAKTLNSFGVKGLEQFEELIRIRLDRQLDYLQRQEARAQVFTLLAKDTKWDLPRDLLQRQARKTLARRVMEMRSAGMTDEQIAGRSRMMEVDIIRSTADALKEHFVLQKIAELEKLEIEDEDIENEIAEIAARSGESYRKVRARMEKDDLIEALATELLERKALDLVLKDAEYEEYEKNPLADGSDDIATMSTEASPASELPPAAAELPPAAAEAKS